MAFFTAVNIRNQSTQVWVVLSSVPMRSSVARVGLLAEVVLDLPSPPALEDQDGCGDAKHHKHGDDESEDVHTGEVPLTARRSRRSEG